MQETETEDKSMMNIIDEPDGRRLTNKTKAEQNTSNGNEPEVWIS